MTVGGAASVHSGAARRRSMLLERFGERWIPFGT